MARILVVDDEPDVRELFNITLKMAGHTTETAKHGLEALDKLATDTPELIVLDLMMPHMDGFSFLAHVRSVMTTKPIRVLVATAKVLEDVDQERLGTWPVVGILNKGELDIGRMVTVVSNALSKSPYKEGVEPAAEGQPASEVAAAPVAAEKTAEAVPADKLVIPAKSADTSPVESKPVTSTEPAVAAPVVTPAVEDKAEALPQEKKEDTESKNETGQQQTVPANPVSPNVGTDANPKEGDADSPEKPSAPAK